jgi:ubiquitin carboxyl-terminal hydrolase 36/42
VFYFQIVFFNPNEVMVGYREHRSAGAGMWNIGNTCYLNSTLQALFHTPAMYNYLINNSAKHLAKCSQARLSVSDTF